MAKSKYETHVKPKLELIACWKQDGFSDEQIYKKLGISKDSFYRYQREFSDFSDCLRESKEIADYKMQNAMYQRGLGYTFEEEKVVKDAEGNPMIMVVKKHIAGDPAVQMFWMKKRKPEMFGDKVEEGNNKDEGVTIKDDLI